jgi:hypothetical protein
MAAPQALTPEQIQQIIAAGRGNTVNLNGTIYQGNYADTGSGETFQEGALQDIYGYTPEQNKVGGTYNQYDPTGAFSRTGTQQEVNANQDFLKFLAGAGLTFALPGALNGSLFGGAGAAANTGTTFAGEALADAGLLAGGGAGAAAASGLTAAQIANLARAGISVAGLLGAGNAITNMGGGGGGNTSTPITYSGGGAGGYSPEYFSQLQSNYNSLMPNVPRDVASPLQNWYSTEFNPGASVTGSLFGGMTGGTSGGMTPVGGVKPVTTPVVKPVTTVPTTTVPTTTVPATTVPTTTVPTTTTPDTVVNSGSAGYQYATQNLGLTPAAYLNNINQWILDNPRASRDQIDAAMAQAGVSQADLQEALRTTTFSDATKYALTSGGSLGDLNNIITNYIEQNPTATNEQIQAQQTQYGISDQDIERAMTALNSSPAKEYAVINDMGLNQYYQNIADAAKSGISAQEAVAQMQQYGVSPGDVSKAYSLFAPSGGLTLDEVLAAYNK